MTPDPHPHPPQAADDAADTYRRQLEVICNNASVALFIKDERQQVVYMNPAAEALTGFSFDELRGRPLHDAVHHTRPDGTPYPRAECPLDRALPRNNREQGEEVFVHKDGHFYPVAFTASPIRDPKLGVVGTVMEVRDVSRERQAQQRLIEESQTIETINAIGSSIGSTLDLQALVQSITDATTRLTGAQFGAFFYNVRNERGESYALYTISGVPREAFSRFPMPRNTHVFAPTFNGDGVIRSDDITKDPRYGQNAPYHGMPQGHLPVTSYLAVPVVSRSGEVLGGLFFGHSRPAVFTARHERMVTGIAAQAAIAIDNARLYEAERKARAAAEGAIHEKDQLLHSERAAREEAERVNRLKDEFLATLSHELRTPLNAILGWAQVLSRTPNLPPDALDAAQVIERNARAQTRLIEDLLDMSRIISGKVRLDVQRVELAAVIEAAVESIRPAAEARDVRLLAALDPLAGPVRGDPNRLQQVVWNLLSNAVKFTPRGGRVHVALERVNSHLEVTVSDTGQGIRPEFLPHVFDRFRQADASTTRRHGGLGLGLSIVKHLVELHGGIVRAKSPGEGMGATFTVELPLMVLHDEPEALAGRGHPERPFGDAAPAAGLPECPSLDGVTVLIVDDEPDARDLLRRLVEGCGAAALLAESAPQAYELARRHRPDVIVSDIGLPDEDGYSLIRKIRALPAADGGSAPALALTAFARSEDRTRAILAGYQVHASKPVEPAELLAILASLVGRTGRPTG